MINKNSYFPLIVRYLSLLVLFFCVVFGSYAQEEPPRPIKVIAHQSLRFGAFINVNGGTVTIGSDGIRTVAGDIIPVFQGMQFHPAIFEVEANPGVLLTVNPGPNINLSGSNGGSLTLTIDGNTSPPSPFVNTLERPFRTQVMVGGTLTVGTMLASPPGEYTGTFFVTFIQQ